MDEQFKKSFLKGSAAASIGTVGAMVCQFISIIMLTRFVTKDDFGIYILILAVVNLFGLFSGFGLRLTTVKFIAGAEREERRKILVPILLIRLVFLSVVSVIFYFGGSLIVKYFDPKIVLYVLPIIFLFILASFRDLFYDLLQALNYFKFFASIGVIAALFRVGLIYFYHSFSTLNLDSLISIEFYATAMPILLQVFVIPFKSLIKWHSETEIYKKIIKFSFPLYFGDILNFILGRANIFVIGLYLNPASVANYDVATRVPMALKKVFQSYIVVYFPHLAKLFSQENKNSAMRLMNKSLIIISAFVAFIVLISFLFSKEIILLLFSERYLVVTLAFFLLILNFFLRIISDLMGYTIVSYGKSAVPPKINTFTSILSVSGAFVLIPMYGFMGAVYSILIMNFVSLILFYRALVNENIGPNLFQIVKPLAITLITVGIYLLIGTEILIVKLFFVILNLIASWLLVDVYKGLYGFVAQNIHKIKLIKSV